MALFLSRSSPPSIWPESVCGYSDRYLLILNMYNSKRKLAPILVTKFRNSQAHFGDKLVFANAYSTYIIISNFYTRSLLYGTQILLYLWIKKLTFVLQLRQMSLHTVADFYRKIIRLFKKETINLSICQYVHMLISSWTLLNLYLSQFLIFLSQYFIFYS